MIENEASYAELLDRIEKLESDTSYWTGMLRGSAASPDQKKYAKEKIAQNGLTISWIECCFLKRYHEITKLANL